MENHGLMTNCVLTFQLVLSEIPHIFFRPISPNRPLNWNVLSMAGHMAIKIFLSFYKAIFCQPINPFSCTVANVSYFGSRDWKEGPKNACSLACERSQSAAMYCTSTMADILKNSLIYNPLCKTDFGSRDWKEVHTTKNLSLVA